MTPLAFTATPAAFDRDALIFDSGAARGADAVTIPLPDIATDAPDGATIEARAVHATSGAEVYGWRGIGTASGGALTGATLTEPTNARRPHWLRVETRVQGSAATPRQTPNRFGVGHVLAIWGQSEIANLLAPFYEGTAPPEPVTADDMVSFHWHTRNPMNSGAAQVVHHLVSAADPYNGRLARMANSLMAARPGEKFAVILQAQSGTGFEQLTRDGATGRAWGDDLALHDTATGGGDVGVVAFDWYAAPRTYGSAYGQVLHQIAFGKTIAGADIGPTPVSIDGRFTADHLLTELYDWSVTRFAVLEPHRFEPGNDANIAACRTAVRAMYDASAETALVGPGHPVLHYRNGRDDGAGGWFDVAHPSPGDGSERFGVGLVQSVIRAAGITSWAYPVIDNAYWAPDGTYVDIWSSAGAIRANGLPPVGVIVDGTPATAAIVNDGGPAGDVTGALRVTAPVGTPFASTTTLDFAPVSTGLAVAADVPTGWDRYPLVDLGVPGLPDGVPLANKPDPAIFASTLAGPSVWTLAGRDEAVVVLASVMNGLTQPITIAIRAALNAQTAATQILNADNTGFLFETIEQNGYRYRAGGHGLGSPTLSPAGSWVPGRMVTYVISLDPSSGRSTVSQDGLVLFDGTGPAWVHRNYQMRMLNSFSGSWTNGHTGDVEFISIWMNTAIHDGAMPASAPDYALSGTPAQVVSQAQGYNAVESTFAIIVDAARAD